MKGDSQIRITLQRKDKNYKTSIENCKERS